MNNRTINEVYEEPTLPILADSLPVRRAATFSRCRRYRYSLTRSWDPALPTILFVGLNPSTADSSRDDPTVRRCIGFAREWGYGTMTLANLFALRSTDPAQLWTARDPIGPDNDEWVRSLADSAAMVVVAWGAHGGLLDRDRHVLAMLSSVHCLGRTQAGQPRHPLYLSKHTPLEVY
jgi:hypothetical protein